MLARLDAGFITDLPRGGRVAHPGNHSTTSRGPDQRFAPSRSAWLKFSWQRRRLATTAGCATRTCLSKDSYLSSAPVHPQQAVPRDTAPSPIPHPRPPRVGGTPAGGAGREGSSGNAFQPRSQQPKGKQAADGCSLSTRPPVLRRKDVLTPATVWASPEATLLSEVRWTRKDKRGRICEVPGAVKPRDRKRYERVPALFVFLGDRV